MTLTYFQKQLLMSRFDEKHDIVLTNDDYSAIEQILSEGPKPQYPLFFIVQALVRCALSSSPSNATLNQVERLKNALLKSGYDNEAAAIQSLLNPPADMGGAKVVRSTPDIIEPFFIKAGDSRVLINGEPPRVDCRIVAEDNYQILLNQKGE